MLPILSSASWTTPQQSSSRASADAEGFEMRSDHGQMVLDPDADPRNANWLRLAAAARLRLPLVTWGLDQRELATDIVDVFAPES